MNDTQEIADRICNALPNIKRGTPRVWGEWFGRPYDNIHTMVKCERDQDVLRLSFEGGEVLSIASPRRLSLSESVFRIKSATVVRWEWFYYGRPQAVSNLYFIEFQRTGLRVRATSNVDFYKPILRPSIFHAAVEILTAKSLSVSW